MIVKEEEEKGFLLDYLLYSCQVEAEEIIEVMELVHGLVLQHQQQIDMLPLYQSGEEKIELGWTLALQEQSLRRAVRALQKFCRREGFFVPSLGEEPGGDFELWMDTLEERLRNLQILEKHLVRVAAASDWNPLSEH